MDQWIDRCEDLSIGRFNSRIDSLYRCGQIDENHVVGLIRCIDGQIDENHVVGDDSMNRCGQIDENRLVGLIRWIDEQIDENRLSEMIRWIDVNRSMRIGCRMD